MFRTFFLSNQRGTTPALKTEAGDMSWRLWTGSSRGFRARNLTVIACLLAGFGVAGCGHEEKTPYASVSKPPVVSLVQPELRQIQRTVGQPSFIESFERTSIYPKLTGYIEKWNVDIGDQVKKGQVLATLFVPELVEDFATKKALVKLDEQRIDLAKKMVEVAEADVKAAGARLDETKAILGKYEADVERWDSEVDRLKKEVKRGVVDPQILLESTNQWKASIASVAAAKATIEKASAELLSKQAVLAKAKVDVSVAVADLAVATSEMKRIEAWVGYITLTSPFDGIVVARNANTGDFVTPAAGDPTANGRAPYTAPGGNAAPIYVIDRTDIVRIFVDIPEQDANFVHIGTKASVLARAYRDELLPCEVTRTSWALNVTSRTLRAEIDLPNPGQHLLPGMYGYAKVLIDRPNVRVLPVSALTSSGDKTYCWVYNNGHSERHEVRTGITDGKWTEVTNLQPDLLVAADASWKPVNGTEKIILGDLSVLSHGAPVDLAEQVEQGEQIADAKQSVTLPITTQPKSPRPPLAVVERP